MDYSHLTNDEIRKKLISMGKNVGPVNDTNRSLYLKTLSGGNKKQTTPKRTVSPKKKTPSPSPTRVSSARRTLNDSLPSVNSYSASTDYVPFNDSNLRLSNGSSVSHRSFNSSGSSAYSRVSKGSPAASPVLPRSNSKSRSDRSFPSETRSFDSKIYKDSPPSSYRPTTTSYFDSSSNYHLSTTPVTTRFQKAKFTPEPPFVVPKKQIKAQVTLPPFAAPIAAGFLAVLGLIIGYHNYSQRVEQSVGTIGAFVSTVVSFCYNYAIVPAVVLLGIALAMYVLYQSYKIHRSKVQVREEEKKKLIQEMLRSIRRAGDVGVPIKQLRDKMMPAYNRTTAQLKLWNEAEEFIKINDTRVRTEERLINEADIAEFFVWSAPFSDDYE